MLESELFLQIYFNSTALGNEFGPFGDVDAPADPNPAFIFNAERDVQFLLHTRQNRRIPQRITLRNLNSLTSSNYDSRRATRFLVHGWFEDSSSDINVDTAAELLEYNDFNVRCL